MLGELNQTLLLFILATIAVGGLAWVFLYPLLSGERAMEKRTASVAQYQPAQRIARGSLKTRREQVEESLKELEQKEQKHSRLSLSQRLSQAGLTWSKQKYILVCAGFGIAAFVTILGMGFGLLPALGLGFAASFGMPYWMLSWLKKRRENRFLNVFPDAVDVIITQDLFVYDMTGEDAQGNLIGRHRSTGIGRPRFWDRARYYGEEKRLAAALDASVMADAELMS